jgi:hypothetical protein
MTAARRNRGTLSRSNTMVTCRSCKKLTHSTIDGMTGLDLCRPCREEAEMENEHNDGYHETPNDKCPDCTNAAKRWVTAKAPAAVPPAMVAVALAPAKASKVDGLRAALDAKAEAAEAANRALAAAQKAALAAASERDAAASALIAALTDAMPA